MAERQRFVEEFYGQVPGYDVPIDFGRKPGPLAKMNQIVLREEMKIENGGPGLPGEQVFRPDQLWAPARPASHGPRRSAHRPADVGPGKLLESGPHGAGSDGRPDRSAPG
jgi:general secretion pathway protein D